MFYNKKIKQINKKLALIDEKLELIMQHEILKKNDYIFKFKDVYFQVNDFLNDYVEKKIVSSGNFYEIELLEYINKYINKGDVILDIGANIGNHTIYWAKNENVSKVISFEPVEQTFNKLSKNIELNNLSNIVNINKLGVGESNTTASIENFNVNNTGANQIKEDKNGDMKVITIDSLNLEKVDLVKIDVEGFEVYALKGMIETLKKHRPLIIIESFEDKFDKVNEILTGIGYTNNGDSVKKDTFIFEYK